jgi:hypothetical protein
MVFRRPSRSLANFGGLADGGILPGSALHASERGWNPAIGV